MANNYTKTMRQALEEARSFRDVTTEGGPGSGPQKGGKKQSSADIKKAYGILNDPRYKQGNYSGAAKAIDKLSPGLSNHPDVKNAMKRANETLDLPATGDTTTSNASQEDIVEKNINEVAPIAIAALVARILGTTVAKNAGSAVKKALSTTPKVANPVAVATTAAAGAPTTTLPESIKVDEATFSKAQMDALVKGFGPLGGFEKNKIKMDKVAKTLSKLPKSALMQLSKANLPMVSKVAKQLSEIGTQSYGSGYKSGYKGGIGVSFMPRNRELSKQYAKSSIPKVATIPMGPKKL